MAEHQADRAVPLLDRLLQAAEAQQRMGSVIEILIAQALAQQAQGDAPAALAALERALTLAEPEGYIRIFVDEGEAMRWLIAECRVLPEKQANREGQRLIRYVDKLLAAFALPAIPQLETPVLHQAQRGASVNNQQSALIEPLSPREVEVLHFIEQGFSNQEIADRLFLALSTVKGYTRTIFDKLQVQRRTEAVARARELGLL